MVVLTPAYPSLVVEADPVTTGTGVGVHVAYYDIVSVDAKGVADTRLYGALNYILLNAIDSVEALSFPDSAGFAQSTRVVQSMTINNATAGDSDVTVSITEDGGTNPIVLFFCTMSTGDTLQYTSEGGWQLLRNGALLTKAAP